jgi:general secretion pathway protein J
LLEVLVSVVVLGLVVVLLNQGTMFGLHATELQFGVRERKGDIEAVDRTLRRLVALADPGIYPEPANLHGTATTISLTTDLPLHGAGQLQRADVALSVEGGRLRLRWTPHRHVAPFGGQPRAQETVILEGVDRIELAYLPYRGAGKWSSSWTGDRLPTLIRMRIVFDKSSGRQWPPIVAAPVREALEE